MSTLLVAAILIGFIVFVCLLLVTLDKHQKQKAMDRMLQRFSAEGMQHNLSFSSQEFLIDGMIGLDGIHRKLLFLKRKTGTDLSAVLINLAEVKKCSVRRLVTLINAMDSKERKQEQHLEKIVLRFEFENDMAPVDVSFYDHVTHSISLASELERKAGYWVTLLSKLITHPQRQPA